MESNLILSIGIYLCFMFALVVYKPCVCYREDGTFKEFGRDSDQTMFTVVVISVLLAVLSYATTIGLAVVNRVLAKTKK